jgi:hypothetical protein
MTDHVSDDLVVILPKRECQGLYDLLAGGLVPMVQLKYVFPTIFAALETALKDDKETPDE